MRHLAKNKLYLLVIAILFTMTYSSCDETNNNSGQYSNGVFVINEGSFGSSNGELSFIHSDNSIYNNLYASNNSSALLGDVFQSMHMVNGKAYLIVNNSNKAEVVNLNNLQSEATITGLTLPRYMVSYNGLGYISEYISYSTPGKVKVVDLSSNLIVDSIDVGNQPENMLVIGDKILVANSGDTTLHIINTIDHTTSTIGNVDMPKYITRTNDGNIWVLYTGKPGWLGVNTDGGLLVLNPTATSIVKNINIGSTATQNPSQLTTDGDHVFYEYLGNVYKIDKTASLAPASPFISSPATSLYGMNYYAASDILYIADANNFITAGTVKRYNATTGAYLDSYTTGIAPNGFVFN
jgi:hypothetical protein